MSLLKLNKISGYDFYTSSIIGFLKKRIAEDGGYAPSPEQKGHTILSYTAINSLAIIGTEEAYKSIDRPKLYQFLLNMKNPDGSFSANEGCEEDVRSTYCALCVASLLNMLTPELSKGSAEFIRSCQGYDGGFAPLPNCETHGGYGFCALGGLKILNRIDIINVNSAIGWCARRQMPFSGGFNGRTNKLVDTCYTWWVGAMAASLSEYTGLDSFWDEKALTSWVVNVCQSQDGGFYDKPGKPVDLFHTMYGLAGLSAAARNAVKELTGFELSEVDSCYAIPKESVAKIKQYFADKPFPS